MTLPNLVSILLFTEIIKPYLIDGKNLCLDLKRMYFIFHVYKKVFPMYIKADDMTYFDICHAL